MKITNKQSRELYIEYAKKLLHKTIKFGTLK